MRKILSSILVVCMLCSSTALAELPNNLLPADNRTKIHTYKPYKLPKPTMLSYGGHQYAAYDLEGFKILLHIDENLRVAEQDLDLAVTRLEYTKSMYLSAYNMASKRREQLDICTTDKVRLTSKWEKEVAARHKSEAKKRGGLFAIAGWTIAGVSILGLGGVILGLVIK